MLLVVAILRHFSSLSLSGFLAEAIPKGKWGADLKMASSSAMSRRVVFLLSRLACTDALPRRRSTVCFASIADFWFSCPLTASSKMYVIGPTASSIRVCRLANCLSRDFFTAGSLLFFMTLSRFGQAVAVRSVRGTVLITPLASGGVWDPRRERSGEEFFCFLCHLEQFHALAPSGFVVIV